MRSGDRQNGKRNILSNAAYSIFRSSNESSKNVPPGGPFNRGLPPAGNRRVTNTTTTSTTSSSTSYLQRSASADNVQIVRQRGFKPSDRHDPAKRNFLESLTSKILHFDMESGNSTPIDLQKLLTPATDSNETLHVRNKKMYASSYFYAPSHPTVEDQVELARRISSSLSDVKNVKSKGQSMYVNRKKRSVKWIHDGNGQEDEEEAPSPIKDKIPLKCMMNPSGKVLDYHGIQALGEEPNIPQVPPHPERLYDIVKDLNNQKGRGAEIFAKRRKRSEKWVVDAEQPQSPSIYGYGKAPTYPVKQDIGVNENLKFDNKPFYTPFDLSMDYNPPLPNCAHQCSRASFSSAHSDCGPCGHEVKKIYLREVAVGTDPEKILRRGSYDGSRPAAAVYAPMRPCNNPPPGNGYGRPARNKGNQNGGGHHHHHHHHHQHGGGRANGYHSHVQNGYNYLNGHVPHEHRHPPGYGGYLSRGGYQNGGGYPNGGGYGNGYPNGGGFQNGGGYPIGGGYQSGGGYQNGNGYANGGYQNGGGYQNRNEYQNGGGCQHASDYQNGNGYPSPSANGNCEEGENPPEDYTPVPVKQLIQEFEKTCRPVMQFKQYPSRSVPVNNNVNQNDLSRYFESRREVIYRQDPQRNQHRGNGYASSGGDDEEDDDDDDDDASLDDSLSPVDFYRVDDRRLLSQQTTTAGNNRSSSMSTLDEYYRRQLQQYQEEKPQKFVNPEAELTPGVKAANLAAVVSQDEITAQRKDLRKTPVLENLVAGTTTPECFKEKFTEEIATKLSDNAYHGPKISSYQNLTNYNTAPRGWNQSQTVYKPIRFEKPQDTKISYSDF